MYLPFFPHKTSFKDFPSLRLSHFFDEPKPPLSFFQGYFSNSGLHILLRAYEIPKDCSYFCFTLLSGNKLIFSKRIQPNKDDFSLKLRSFEGENFRGHFWGAELFVAKKFCKQPLYAIIGLFHDNIPLCFLTDNTQPSQMVYPLVNFKPKPHLKSSSAKIQSTNR